MRFTILPVAASALALAGCGGGYSLAFPPSLETDFPSVAAAAEGRGMTGFLGFRDGSLREVLVELSDDQETAWITVEGSPRRELTRIFGTDGDSSGTWSDGDQFLIIPSTTSALSAVQFEDSVLPASALGFGGVWTPEANLPETGVVGYSGSFYVVTALGSANGGIVMDVDFGGKSISGSFTGVGNAGASNFVLAGTIDGALTGGVLHGTVDDPAVGSMAFEGAFYNSGAAAAGAVGGTLNGYEYGGQWSVSD